MRGVAVDASRSLVVVLFQQFLAVDGALEGFQLVVVAATTQGRNVLAPFCVFGRGLVGGHVEGMGVMALGTSRLGQ